jgi:hypothetical protein
MNKRIRVGMALVMLVSALALAPGASGAVDYSKNSVSGDYAPAAAPTVDTATTAGDPGFAWGDAAVGAGAALALALLAMTLTPTARRMTGAGVDSQR